MIIDGNKIAHTVASANYSALDISLLVDKHYISYLESKDRGNPFDYPVRASEWEYYKQQLESVFDEKANTNKIWQSMYSHIYSALQ